MWTGNPLSVRQEKGLKGEKIPDNVVWMRERRGEDPEVTHSIPKPPFSNGMRALCMAWTGA